MLVMYRPVQQTTQSSSVKSTFLSQRNYDTLQTVLIQDFQRRISAPLNDQQISRLNKSLNHYIEQVYTVNGEKQPLQTLNREVLTACAQDFTKYIQRKDAVQNNTVSSVKTVMDETLFQEVGQRYERLTQERNEVKALPPAVPDFRISLSEDGPAPAQLYEMAKKHREMEALRSAHNNSEMMKATMGMQSYVSSDSSFKGLQDAQNRNTEMALYERQNRPRDTTNDMPLVVMPDRRELMLAPVGTFDTMTQSPMPRELGNANSNSTIVQPELASPMKNDLPQNYVVREEKTVSYKEVENNLFIYSADRDWLRNNKENRYNFTVSFDPAANGQSFGPNPGVQQKFKNIVRIEFVKAIMPCEGLDVLLTQQTSAGNISSSSFQDNILSFPYVSVRVAELENNNFGTDNFLDRSFGVLQYDANWISDTTQTNTRGYVAMIPKFLKCEKVYHPTPLSTLQKLTIDIHRPNGELISTSPDTFDVYGIIGSNYTNGTTLAAPYDQNLISSAFFSGAANNPSFFFIRTTSYFSKFQIAVGDRIQLNGFTWDQTTLDNTPSLRDFSNWINNNTGFIVAGIGHNDLTISGTSDDNTYSDGFNNVGYANYIIIQARYKDPSTGSISLNPFSSTAIGLNTDITTNISNQQQPARLIDLNKQLTLVFRVITREMDALPQLRPDNNY